MSMTNQNKKISSNTLAFSIACFFQGTSLLSSFITGVTRQDTWITVISGFILNMLIVYVYVILAKQYPSKNLIEINDMAFGKVIGKIFSILYIFYFFSLAFLDSRILGDFVAGYLMPETPMSIILILFIFTCCYCARKGTKVLTMNATLFVAITTITPLFTTALLIPDMKLSNFLPIFSLPFKSYFQSTHTLATIPSSGTFLFFMLFPDLKNPKEIAKPLTVGTCIGMATMLFFVLRDTAIMGANIALFASPTYEVVRLINVANIFTRMEVLYAVVLIVLLFFQISMIIFATAKAISTLFKLQSYTVIVPAIGSLTVSFAIVAFQSSDEHDFWGANFSAVYVTIFAILLPLGTLLTTAMRRVFVEVQNGKQR